MWNVPSVHSNKLTNVILGCARCVHGFCCPLPPAAADDVDVTATLMPLCTSTGPLLACDNSLHDLHHHERQHTLRSAFCALTRTNSSALRSNYLPASATQPIAAPVQAVVGGTASSGLLICLLRMATKAGGGTDQASLRRSTALYFACSAAITLAGLLAYWLVMPKLSILNVKRRKLQQPGALSARAPAAAGGSVCCKAAARA
jgi:hypothetical protein